MVDNKTIGNFIHFKWANQFDWPHTTHKRNRNNRKQSKNSVASDPGHFAADAQSVAERRSGVHRVCVCVFSLAFVEKAAIFLCLTVFYANSAIGKSSVGYSKAFDLRWFGVWLGLSFGRTGRLQFGPFD